MFIQTYKRFVFAVQVSDPIGCMKGFGGMVAWSYPQRCWACSMGAEGLLAWLATGRLSPGPWGLYQ